MVRALIMAVFLSNALGGQLDISKVNMSEKIVALKNGRTVFIRSFFSFEQHILIRIGHGTGANEEFDFQQVQLIPAGLSTFGDDFHAGIIIHGCIDEATPLYLNDTFIDGNHGAVAAVEITSENHGLSEKDLGKEMLVEDARYYLVKIVDSNCFWIMSENTSQNRIWHFDVSPIKSALLEVASGKVFQIQKSASVQLTPSCRINRKQYLLDHKTSLIDGIVMTGDFLEVVEAYDIIAPDAVLKAVKQNPGHAVNFVGKDLDSVATIEITYRFLPLGTCIVEQRCRINRDVKWGHAGFVQSQQLAQGNFQFHEYYIPKTKPFKKYGREYNFSGIENFSGKLAGEICFSIAENNLSDPQNLPDRFMQFLGDSVNGKIYRKVGFVMGYSLLNGITRPEVRIKNTDTAGFISVAKKTYPFATNECQSKVFAAGTEFKCTAYRQYYIPSSASDNATSVYWHKEADSYILYADYHNAVDNDIIRVPAHWNGKHVSVIDKSSSIFLVSGDFVPPNGIAVSLKQNYGYIVLKCD